MRVVVAALFVVGCGGGTGSSDGNEKDKDGTLDGGACDEPAVVITSGYDPVAPLARDGSAVIQMVHGPQGGWHIDAGGIVTLPSPEVAVEATFVVDGHQIAGDQSPTYLILAAYDAETCTGDFFEVRVFVDDELAELPKGSNFLDDYICPLADKPITVELTVSTLGDGAVSETDTVEGTLRLDEYDQSFCAKQ